MTISIVQAAGLLGLDERTIRRYVEERKVGSPKAGRVFLKSLLDFYTYLHGSVIDTVAKNRYAEKLAAEKQRIDIDSLYKVELTKEIKRRHLIGLTLDEQSAISLRMAAAQDRMLTTLTSALRIAIGTPSEAASVEMLQLSERFMEAMAANVLHDLMADILTGPPDGETRFGR
jgi:hypothetical protein